jgi:hypothetical protein
MCLLCLGVQHRHDQTHEWKSVWNWKCPGQNTCVRRRGGYRYLYTPLFLLRNQQYPELFSFSKNDRANWKCLSVLFGTSKRQGSKLYECFCRRKNEVEDRMCSRKSWISLLLQHHCSLESQNSPKNVVFRSASRKTSKNQFHVCSFRKPKNSSSPNT